MPGHRPGNAGSGRDEDAPDASLRPHAGRGQSAGRRHGLLSAGKGDLHRGGHAGAFLPWRQPHGGPYFGAVEPYRRPASGAGGVHQAGFFERENGPIRSGGGHGRGLRPGGGEPEGGPGAAPREAVRAYQRHRGAAAGQSLRHRRGGGLSGRGGGRRVLGPARKPDEGPAGDRRPDRRRAAGQGPAGRGLRGFGGQAQRGQELPSKCPHRYGSGHRHGPARHHPGHPGRGNRLLRRARPPGGHGGHPPKRGPGGTNRRGPGQGSPRSGGRGGPAAGRVPGPHPGGRAAFEPHRGQEPADPPQQRGPIADPGRLRGADRQRQDRRGLG